ncbi:MAG: hypothetical protein IT233_07660 [Bacteroidia bacterium]|nr:hypothetical protein [Bacteroidia bacterium]
MINADNYYSKVNSLDISSLPAPLQKGHEFVNKVTQSGMDWNTYHSSPTIKKVVDDYFEKLSSHLPVKEEKKQRSSEQKQERKPKEEKPRKERKEKEPAAEEEEDVELVERIPEELRFMKRYLNLNGKRKTKDELLRFINGLQRAILERRIRKESEWAKQVLYIQENLLKVYNGMKGRTAEIEIPGKVIAEFKEEINGESVFKSIQFIKRYVSLHGKVGIKEKAAKLYEQMNRAVKKGKIVKDDKYAVKLNEIWKSLKEFLEDKKAKTLPMNSAELNGLLGLLGTRKREKLYDTREKRIKTIKKGNIVTFKKPFYPRGTSDESRIQILITGIRKEKSGAIKLEGFGFDSDWYKSMDDLLNAINWEWMEQVHSGDDLEGCECGLNGIEEGEDNKLMSSMEFADMTFDSIGFTGKWRELIGDPAPGFSAMVFGRPKMGKSYLCVEFAGYLARNHGKVLYVAREEGLDKTLQIKLNDKNVKHPNLFVSDYLPEDLSGYDFIFLDSVNKLGLSPAHLDSLRKTHKGKSFIFVFQTTKDGNFRGKNEFQHDVDVVIEIPQPGKAVQFGRYNQGGAMDIFE